MDQQTLEFHIAANDYFGTLATILDIAAQQLHAGSHRADIAQLLTKKRDELLYLQEHCRIDRR